MIKYKVSTSNICIIYLNSNIVRSPKINLLLHRLAKHTPVFCTLIKYKNSDLLIVKIKRLLFFIIFVSLIKLLDTE